MLEVLVKQLHPDARFPTYGSAGAACFDLYSISNREVVSSITPCVFQTGIAFEIPVGHVMLIFPRSGHGFKNGVRLANCVGVIDSDYRGEVLVKLTGDEFNNRLTVSKGDRIAQAMVVPVEQVRFIASDNLSETERGSGGFGSTGA